MKTQTDSQQRDHFNPDENIADAIILSFVLIFTIVAGVCHALCKDIFNVKN